MGIPIQEDEDEQKVYDQLSSSNNDNLETGLKIIPHQSGYSDMSPSIRSQSTTGPTDTAYFDGMQPLILERGGDDRKTSVILSLDDLSSIMNNDKNKKINSFRSALERMNETKSEENAMNERIEQMKEDMHLLIETNIEIQDALKS